MNKPIALCLVVSVLATGCVSVPSGPSVMVLPGSGKAFNEFHNNLHRLTADSIGPVAPGLHNGKGGEITATAC